MLYNPEHDGLAHVRAAVAERSRTHYDDNIELLVRAGFDRKLYLCRRCCNLLLVG